MTALSMQHAEPSASPQRTTFPQSRTHKISHTPPGFPCQGGPEPPTSGEARGMDGRPFSSHTTTLRFATRVSARIAPFEGASKNWRHRMPLFEGCPAQRVAFCSRMWWTRGKTRSGEVLGFEGRGAQTRFAKEIRRVPLTPKQRSSLWSAEPTARRKNYCHLSERLDGLPFAGQIWRRPRSKIRAAVVAVPKEERDFSL
jgi:hypothetical protein